MVLKSIDDQVQIATCSQLHAAVKMLFASLYGMEIVYKTVVSQRLRHYED